LWSKVSPKYIISFTHGILISSNIVIVSVGIGISEEYMLNNNGARIGFIPDRASGILAWNLLYERYDDINLVIDNGNPKQFIKRLAYVKEQGPDALSMG